MIFVTGIVLVDISEGCDSQGFLYLVDMEFEVKPSYDLYSAKQHPSTISPATIRRVRRCAEYVLYSIVIPS